MSFQFQSPVQIFKFGFTPYVEDLEYDTSAYELDPHFYLSADRESWLLYISIFLPELVSVLIVYLLLNYYFRKLHSYRVILFQNTIEGERLSRIAPFSELAQDPHVLSYIVSDMVRKSPGSAHLQSKFKANLLKIFSLFEIKERRPMPEHIRWACKIRPTTFSWKKSLLSKLSFSRHMFTRLPNSDDSNADALADIGVKDSFKSYIFKSFEQKYARKVGFSQVALEKSLSSYRTHGTELNKSTKDALNWFKKDKFIEFDSRFDDTDAILEAKVVERIGLPCFENCFELEAISSLMGSRRKIYDFVVVSIEYMNNLNIASETYMLTQPQKMLLSPLTCIR